MSQFNTSVFFFISIFCFALQSCSDGTDDQTEKISFENKFNDSKIRAIYNSRDKRNTKELLTYLDQDSIYQIEALIALGSVQDTSALPALKQKLETSNSLDIKIATAFAIGQIADPSINPFLIKFIIDHEKETELLKYVFEALGHCANDGAIYLMTHFVLSDEHVMKGIVKGLYRAKTWQGFESYDAAEQVMRIFTKSKDTETKEWCSAYFARLSSSNMVATFNSNIFANARRNNNELIRSNFALSIAAFSKGGGSSTALKKILHEEKSPMVLESALIATEKIKYDGMVEETMAFLNHEDPIVASVAASKLYKKLGWKESKQVYQVAKDMKHPHAQALALKAVMYERNKQKDIYNFTKGLYDQASSVYEKCYYLDALSNSKLGKDLVFETWKTTTEIPLKTKAIELLMREYASEKSLNSKEGAELGRIISDALKTKDVAQIYTTCSFMQNNSKKFKKYYPAVQLMEEVKTSLELPLQVEAFIELEKTIAHLESKEYNYDAPKENKGVQWDYIKKIKQDQKAIISTEKGDITIALKVNEAPATASMFVSLADSGFYDQLHFHRLVPNFVAQGGDPRGDGFGGLNYSIPSEFTQLEFTEGSLGIASAGKDTESCQFFFTLVPTHHLDGRYTVFAQVVEGLDIMRKIQYGDKINSIKIVRELEVSDQKAI
ncbi:peptidylprolyl isomerase [Flammeovirga agarivorans]|nr:peptidylprolyl isomerase [Flammeovirga agarivorans]